MMAGRRWGKTLAIAARMVAKASDGKYRAWYISPTSAQNEQILEFFDCADIHPLIRKYKRSYPQEITFLTGATISFRTFMRPERLRSKGLHEVYVDEIQDITDQMGFWSVIRPIISDKRGNLIVSGQFRGQNWVYNDLYIKGIEGPKKAPKYKSFIFPTSTGIAFQSPQGRAELEDAKMQVPSRVWDQEYECIPTENIYSVFRSEDLDMITEGTSTDKSRINPDTGQPYQYVAALDLGKTIDHSFHTVLEIGDQIPTVVFTDRRPLREKHSLGAQAAARINRDFGGCTLCVDCTGGATGGHVASDSYTKYYRQHISSMRAFYWGRNKPDIINDLVLAVEQGQLYIPEVHETLHHELRVYEFKTRFAGVEYGAPSGEHDDSVASLAMAWQAYLRKWWQTAPSGIEHAI